MLTYNEILKNVKNKNLYNPEQKASYLYNKYKFHKTMTTVNQIINFLHTK